MKGTLLVVSEMEHPCQNLDTSLGLFWFSISPWIIFPFLDKLHHSVGIVPPCKKSRNSTNPLPGNIWHSGERWRCYGWKPRKIVLSQGLCQRICKASSCFKVDFIRECGVKNTLSCIYTILNVQSAIVSFNSAISLIGWHHSSRLIEEYWIKM